MNTTPPKFEAQRRADPTGQRPRKLALVLLLAMPLVAAGQPNNLENVSNFGPNQGNLLMFKYVPRNFERSRPLVVALHGCTQKASDYDDETGWTMLADKLRFALLLPEQQPANNDRRCFNWFLPGDNERDKGEAKSIKEMIDKITADHEIDPKQIYVTGLSAGGGMTTVMLAAYPDVFAGGGIIAGIPYKCANDVIAALTKCGVFGGSMQEATPKQWGDRVRAASQHKGPFPRVSIWHGSADSVVKPKDMQELMKQWTNVSGIDQTPEIDETIKGSIRHQVFEDAGGKALVETFLVASMEHGTPIDIGPEEDQCGSRPHATHIREAGICSSFYITRFWGLHNQAPSISISSSTGSGTSVTVNGLASDPDGFVSKVSVALEGTRPQAAKDAVGTDNWSVTFTNVPNNTRYIPAATARDDQGMSTTTTATTPVVVGTVPPNNPPRVTINDVAVQGSCITVKGTASDPDPDGNIDRVEVALGTEGFKPAVLSGQNYSFTACNLTAGTYTSQARATDNLGAPSELISGNVVKVERQPENVNATWQEHLNAGRLRAQQAPCRAGFGSCDEEFSAIFLKHGSNPFTLFKAFQSEAWFVDENKAKQS